MPVSVPDAAYGTKVQVITDTKPRCWKCNRVLAWYATRPWHIKCSRCNSSNARQAEYASVSS